MLEPDKAPKVVARDIARTYWRPRTFPTRLSAASNSTDVEPERNRISPIKTNSGMAVRVPVVVVLKTELTTMPKAPGPRNVTTPTTLMTRNARKIGIAEKNSASSSMPAMPSVIHHSMVRRPDVESAG